MKSRISNAGCTSGLVYTGSFKPHEWQMEAQTGAKVGRALPISCVNHISRSCANLQAATRFYETVLGFLPVQRPRSLDFDGVWLFNYGIGVHLLQAQEGSVKQFRDSEIDPKADHLSFQCAGEIIAVQEKLEEHGVKYLRRQVEEGGIVVDQLFFHDPEGFMIEVCNCENLPVVPLTTSSAGPLNMPQEQQQKHLLEFSACSFPPFTSPVQQPGFAMAS
ncbi:hypothetical protein R1sor_006395 [Riccia sorocarpa]|uniref:VOC domain-containing protein n=1 Tax=Riccia sorocarpa TaxID=122646 RepID=A0ABD3HQX8_9MARC